MSVRESANVTRVHLRYGDAEEAFRSELVTWLDANLPPAELRSEPKESSAHLPEWARRWQRTLFDDGWLVPGWPPELGGLAPVTVSSHSWGTEAVVAGYDEERLGSPAEATLPRTKSGSAPTASRPPNRPQAGVTERSSHRYT